MDSAPLCQLHKVHVRYGTRTVLDGVSLAVRRGDFWAIVGPNGAGKSTLMGLCNGMTGLPHNNGPVTGDISFQGQPLHRGMKPRTLAAVRLGMAHVFQATDLDPKMPLTVLEAVLCGTYARLGLFKRPGHREKHLALQALEAVGLSHLASRPIGQLSGGERQRTALARALAQEPQLLLLDEPTAALDWQAQREILNTIGELRRNFGLTIVMVTHDLNAVFSLAGQVLMLREGRVLWQGPVGEAAEEARLSALYNVPITVAQHQGRTVTLF